MVAVKQIGLAVIFLVFATNFATAEWKIADVGFRGDDFYLGILPETIGPEFAYLFSLCSTKQQKCEALNECKYGESAIVEQIKLIRDPKVKNDFKWVFLRSDYSSTILDSFFTDLKILLEKVRPNCGVRSLESLKASLKPSAG